VYIPDGWNDTRLNPISEFITRMMFGDKTLKLTIEEKLTAYHAIAKRLNKRDMVFNFVRGMVIINIDNYEDALFALDAVQESMSNQPDSVITLDPRENMEDETISKAESLGFKDIEMYHMTPMGHIVSIGLSTDDINQSDAYKLLSS
jgi:hypothetical protein